MPFCLWALNVHSSLQSCSPSGQDCSLCLLRNHALSVHWCGGRSRDFCLRSGGKQDSFDTTHVACAHYGGMPYPQASMEIFRSSIRMLVAAQRIFRWSNGDARTGMCHNDQQTRMPVREPCRPVRRTRGILCSVWKWLRALRPAERA